MPYRSSLFQAALGAISVAALFISHSFGGSDPRHKRVVGAIVRTGERTFQLTDHNAREYRFQLAKPAQVFLNENEIAFPSIENGRQAAVRYTKRSGQFFATSIEIFPTHIDFDSPVEGPKIAALDGGNHEIGDTAHGGSDEV